MSVRRLGPETIRAVADRLKVLAESARLSILNELRSGPRNVSELIEATGRVSIDARPDVLTAVRIAAETLRAADYQV